MIRPWSWRRAPTTCTPPSPRSSEWTGANLYDWLGYTPLVLISTAFTAAAWLLVPLVPIDAIQAAAAAAQTETSPPA